MADYKIYSFNVRGIRQRIKRGIVFRHLKKKVPQGIYLLQETHCSVDMEQTWKLEWNGSVFFSHGTTDSCGVTTLIHPDLDLEILDIIKDDEGRFLALKIKTNMDEEIFIMNCYAPTRDKVQGQLTFLDYLKDILCSVSPVNIIMGGDFNTVFDPALDKQGGNLDSCTNQYTKELIAFMETFDLLDALRFQHPNRKIFTRVQRTPPVLSRIDHWLISSHLANCLKTTRALPGVKSDHSIIFLNLCTSTAQRGRGFWKFNAQLLKDIEYVNKVSNMITTLRNDTVDLSDKHVRWDYIKTEIRGFTIQYSSRKKKEKREFKMKLEKDLYEIQDQLLRNMSPADVEKYHFLKEEIEKIEEIETKGAILRSKIRWSEAGEKNTKYFLNLERRNAVNKHISQLQLENGDVTSDPKVILNEQKIYYQKLYSDLNQSEPENKSLITQSFTEELSTLPEDEMKRCEGLITEKECAEALKSMENGKSPGCDGFTVDFYKVFWNDIKSLLVESINFSYEKGILSVDQRRGIITLIPKKNKIRLLLKNWRPISLLNTDYKILTKSLASRLNKVLPSIINLDQTGFLRGRYIGENIRTISDLIEYTSLRNQPGIILLLDFEKAFDTIKWSFIFESLELFNFGPEFIHWIKTIYCDPESTVINYGNTTAFFKLQRGIRQGCPISPYLFILAVEVMANGIRKSKNITGIKVRDIEFKVSQLADDTTVFVSNFESIGHVLQLLENFHIISGLKLNIEKTLAKCIGSLGQNECQNLYNLTWTKGPLQTLGILITNDSKLILNDVFLPRLKVFGNILDMWNSRGLTLKGKITILKSLALPQLQYPMSVLPVPTVVVDMVDHMISDFIWSKRKSKIKKEVIIQRIEKGGIKAPNFATMVEANRVSWIKRLLHESDQKWKCIFSDLIKPYSILHFSETHLDDQSINAIKIPFYKQVYQVWNKIRSKPENAQDFQEQVLWKNKYITLPENPKSKVCKPLSWPNLYRIGIVKVKHLFGTGFKFINLLQFCKNNNIECNFLQPLRIRKAISQEWITAITSSSIVENEKANLVIKTGESISYICNSTSKMIYEEIVLSRYIRPTALNRWLENFEIDEVDWPNIFKQAFMTTRETKLQTLQYKILHRIIPCQKWLFDQRVISSPYCARCSDNCIDTILHHFIECRGLDNFWKSLETWWNNTSTLKVQLSKKHILFGMYYDNLDFSTLNYVILLSKWYIYTHVYRERKTDLHGFLVLLKHHLEMERQIQYCNGKITQFNKKWNLIYNKL